MSACEGCCTSLIISSRSSLRMSVARIASIIRRWSRVYLWLLRVLMKDSPGIGSLILASSAAFRALMTHSYSTDSFLKSEVCRIVVGARLPFRSRYLSIGNDSWKSWSWFTTIRKMSSWKQDWVSYGLARFVRSAAILNMPSTRAPISVPRSNEIALAGAPYGDWTLPCGSF